MHPDLFFNFVKLPRPLDSAIKLIGQISLNSKDGRGCGVQYLLFMSELGNLITSITYPGSVPPDVLLNLDEGLGFRHQAALALKQEVFPSLLEFLGDEI
jgi:hypothetical protein